MAFNRRIIGGGHALKPTMANLLLTSLTQACLFTTLIVVSNCAVLGVNPVSTYRRMSRHNAESWEMFDDTVVSDGKVIPGLPEGTRYRDLPKDLQDLMFEQSMTTVILLDLMKSVGLSEKTVLIVEQDLRNQNLASLQVNAQMKRNKTAQSKAEEEAQSKV